MFGAVVDGPMPVLAQAGRRRPRRRGRLRRLPRQSKVTVSRLIEGWSDLTRDGRGRAPRVGDPGHQRDPHFHPAQASPGFGRGRQGQRARRAGPRDGRRGRRRRRLPGPGDGRHLQPQGPGQDLARQAGAEGQGIQALERDRAGGQADPGRRRGWSQRSPTASATSIIIGRARRGRTSIS